MYENQTLKTIEQILDNYVAEDYDVFEKTVNEIQKKGIPNGYYIDYAILTDVLAILTVCKNIVKNKAHKTTVNAKKINKEVLEKILVLVANECENASGETFTFLSNLFDRLYSIKKEQLNNGTTP